MSSHVKFLFSLQRGWRALVLLAGVFGACFATWAQNWPVKPIRMLVAFPPGGPTDLVSRVIAQRLSEQLGQPVLIDNKPGAGGNIAAEMAANAPADGYTLFYNTSAIVIGPALYGKVNYDTLIDFAPVALTASVPLVLVVNGKSKINSVAELVATMKAQPEKSNYGGSGPAFQFANELFKLKTGAPGEFVQYKSMSETITALISGDLMMSMVDTGPATAHIASGQLRALAVTSPQRLSSMPQTPTMAELGFKDIEFRYWSALFAPAGTPKEIVQKLELEVNRILKQAEVIAQMAAIQVTATGSSSQELSKWLAADLLKWNAVAEGALMKK